MKEGSLKEDANDVDNSDDKDEAWSLVLKARSSEIVRGAGFSSG